MLEPKDFHQYQKRAVNHQIACSTTALWVGMGLGKTIITLTTIAHLLAHRAIRAALVIGPLRVVQSVWETEAKKWSHTRHLRFSLITGTPMERLRAIAAPADVYLVNYENVVWMHTQLDHYYVKRGTLLPFDFLVLDEISKMKKHNTKRIEALAHLLPYFHRRTGLTGTPASQGLGDLFGQFLCLDNGQRLGTSYDRFIQSHFTPRDRNGYKYEPTAEGERHIHRVVSDITLELSQKEYLQLPDLIVNDIEVDLKPQHRRQYEELEQDLFTELDNGVELEVLHEGSKTNKCLQYSNGATYTNTETREWHVAHDAKLEALDDIMEEAAGEQVLIAYNYRPDAHRILERFKGAKSITGMSGAQFAAALADWREGRQQILIGHPASMGHGIDGLQDTCNIVVWFGLNWSLELTLQLNARVHRQGQSRPVVVHRILTKDTLDYAVAESLSTNARTQDNLISAVNAYRKRKAERSLK